MKRVLWTAIFVASLATTAHAQEKSVRCSIGYAFSHYLEEDGGSAPFGLLFSAQSTKDLGLKVEFGYHRDSNDDFDITLNTFTGMIGPVATFQAGSAQSFIHLLFGGREDRVEGEGNFAIGGELGAGFDIPVGTGVFLRPGIDYQVFTDDGFTLNVLRFSFGISF